MRIFTYTARALQNAVLPSAVARWCCVFIIVFPLSLKLLAVDQPPSVALGPVTVGTKGTVSFVVYPLSSSTDTPAKAVQVLPDETDDRRFGFYVDADSIAPKEFETFRFEAYVEDRHEKTWYRFGVKATPTGQFDDIREKVTFKIERGGHESYGTTVLALHSGSLGDLIKAELPAPLHPLEVSLSSRAGPSIHVKNLLESLSLQVTKMDASYNCSDCWEPLAEKPITNIGPNQFVTMAVPFRPRPLAALLAGVMSINKESSHDILHLELTYKPDQGGRERTQEFEIPVRFKPTIWELAFAVLIGSSLGLLAKGFLNESRSQKSKISKRDIGEGLTKALVAEVIGVFAVSYNSQLVILGFDFDPTQFLPATVLALLVTGGPTVSSWIQATLLRSSSDARVQGDGSPKASPVQHDV